MNEEGTMPMGLRTAIYHVDDMAEARAWYAAILGRQPYFNEDFYIGFDVNGFELGLHPRTDVAKGNSVHAYWRVPDVHAAHERALRLGAREHEAPRDVGGNIIVATVLDPWENVFGFISDHGTEEATPEAAH